MRSDASMLGAGYPALAQRRAHSGPSWPGESRLRPSTCVNPIDQMPMPTQRVRTSVPDP